MFDDRYEVERQDYKSFIETFKASARRIEEENTDDAHIVRVINVRTNECMSARVSYEDAPERYYIFSLPSGEDYIPPVPRQRVVLTDIKQVQAFFDGLKKMQELHKHDRDI